MSTPLLDLASTIQNAIRNNTDIELTSSNDHLIPELVNVMLDFPEKPAEFSIDVVMAKRYKKVILVSGGADSTIMWELNKHEESTLGVYVNLGVTYADKEMEALKMMGIPFKHIDYPLHFEGFWKHIIPTRNFALIALAEQFVDHEGEIWLGAVQGEADPDMGDKSELFFRLVESFIWRTRRKKVYIKTLKDKTKNDWLKWYIDKTGNMKIIDTITCFDGTTEKPCGKCQACLRKWISLRYCNIETDGFFEVDPYAAGVEYIQKYKDNMLLALETKKFDHYSKDRCEQDLKVIFDYEEEIKK